MNELLELMITLMPLPRFLLFLLTGLFAYINIYLLYNLFQYISKKYKGYFFSTSFIRVFFIGSIHFK